MSYETKILIVSDRVSQGLAEDSSGPSLKLLLEKEKGFKVEQVAVVPDEVVKIKEQLNNWASEQLGPQLLLTCGGTGFGVRDVTPEAVSSILDKPASGLVTAMLVGGLNKTPLAALSRPVAGVLKTSLVVTLPGSPKGACENLSAILPVLPHALKLAGGVASDPHPKTLPPTSNPTTTASNTIPSSGVISCPLGHIKTSLTPSSVAHRPRQSPHPMMPFDEALEKVLTQAKSLASQWSSIKLKLNDPQLHGSVLAETVVAAEPVPAYRASIVDGYAVCSSNPPGVYPVLGVSLAAPLEEHSTLPSGYVMRISTGAPVPDGADAVVMVEDTELEEEVDGVEKSIKFLQTVKPGANIRPIGSDITKGDVILPQGHRIDALLGWGADLGLLASSGLQEILVYPRPRVGVLSTGSEVVNSDCTELKLGQIRDANRPTLLAALRSHGFDSVDLGIVSDSRDLIEKTLLEGYSRLDVIITTGGVSMGEADLVKPILLDAPYQLHFGRVAMKPGKPTTFATFHRNSTSDQLAGLTFSLPGNPVSATVSFNLFVLPALLALLGHPHPVPPRVPVTLLHDLPLDPRPEFVRAVYAPHPTTGFVARSTGNQISSRLLSITHANALLTLPPASPPGQVIPAGQTVDAILIGPPVHRHLLD